jgi:hypothetical protein
MESKRTTKQFDSSFKAFDETKQKGLKATKEFDV